MNGRHLRHDLRTLLHHIIGYGEMLVEEFADLPAERDNLALMRLIVGDGRKLLQRVNAAPQEADASPAAFGGWREELNRLDERIDYAYARIGVPAPPWVADLDRIGHAARVLRALFMGVLDPRIEGLPAHEVVPGDATADGAAPAGRLLLVDDDATNLHLMARRLTREGFDVGMAGSGRDALARLAQERFDLVLLDLLMPEMNGLEVLAAIRTRFSPHELPVIAVTARHSSAIIVEALEQGANDYITKPIDFPVALARIATQRYLRRVTLELREANERLHRYSYLDGLTGVANRRKLDEFLQAQWSLAREQARPLAVVMIDVDHFKRYNDHYGHEAGDYVLIHVAQSLQGALADSDGLLGRYGGEEFVAVLPGFDQAAAHAMADRLRTAVLALAIPHEAHPEEGCVTVSVGVAAAPGESSATLGLLVKRADHAMYRSKRAGRNRVQSWRLEADGERDAAAGLP